MGLKLSNNAISSLASSITASSTTIALKTGDGAKFPTLGAGDYHPATISKPDGSLEIVRVTARSGDTLTVARAQEATTALSFDAGSLIEVRLTAGTLEEIASIDGLPDQTGQDGKYLKTNGTTASWEIAGYDPAGTASSAVSAHVAAADPHSQYALDSDVATALAGKQETSAKNTANGYAGLDSSGLIPTSLMPVCYAQSNRIDTDISIPDGYNGVWFGDTEVGPNVTVTGLGNSTLRGL